MDNNQVIKTEDWWLSLSAEEKFAICHHWVDEYANRWWEMKDDDDKKNIWRENTKER